MVGLGEILWDLLPSGRQLGGAPANFAFHAAQLGNLGVAASRVGTDDLGNDILDRLGSLGLSAEFIQRDPVHPTGTVKVEIGSGGQPRYTIVENVAWDHLEWTPELEQLAARTNAVCFGSLAQRAPDSRKTILRFLSACRPDALRIFDINLRGEFFTPEIIESGLSVSRIAKMNDEELPRVAEIVGAKGMGEESLARELIRRFGLKLVCVTRGARGSLLASAGEISVHPGFQVSVADTVGSGDAFVAAVAHHYLRGAPLEKINQAANRLGAWVATQLGATPRMSDELLAEIA